MASYVKRWHDPSSYKSWSAFGRLGHPFLSRLTTTSPLEGFHSEIKRGSVVSARQSIAQSVVSLLNFGIQKIESAYHDVAALQLKVVQPLATLYPSLTEMQMPFQLEMNQELIKAFMLMETPEVGNDWSCMCTQRKNFPFLPCRHIFLRDQLTSSSLITEEDVGLCIKASEEYGHGMVASHRKSKVSSKESAQSTSGLAVSSVGKFIQDLRENYEAALNYAYRLLQSDRVTSDQLQSFNENAMVPIEKLAEFLN